MSKQKITKASICSCRNLKRILSAVLSVMLMITVSAGLDFSALAVEKSGGSEEFEYLIIDDQTAAIVGYTGSSSRVVVPAVIDYHRVILIGVNAFADNKNMVSIELPADIDFIRQGAFKDCVNLKDVYYGGTESQWNSIDIGVDNECLLNADIHFGGSAVTAVFADLEGFEYYNTFVVYTSIYNSFLKGTNPPANNVFEPVRAIDRAMMVTILYRMAGEPYANGGNPYTSSPFTDITDTSVYYYDAACWALKNGVTTETTFKPFNNVTREQTATFLYRHAQDNDKLGDADYKNVNLNDYHDGNSISHFAVDAMK